MQWEFAFKVLARVANGLIWDRRLNPENTGKKNRFRDNRAGRWTPGS
jgi:hypothetical protein